MMNSCGLSYNLLTRVQFTRCTGSQDLNFILRPSIGNFALLIFMILSLHVVQNPLYTTAERLSF